MGLDYLLSILHRPWWSIDVELSEAIIDGVSLERQDSSKYTFHNEVDAWGPLEIDSMEVLKVSEISFHV